MRQLPGEKNVLITSISALAACAWRHGPGIEAAMAAGAMDVIAQAMVGTDTTHQTGATTSDL